MHIDTHSFETMKETLCQYFDIKADQLLDFFHLLDSDCIKGGFFNGDILDDGIDRFVAEHIPANKIDEILFFHLGRRLNLAHDIFSGDNLFDALTTKNELSCFLKEHEITFIPEGNQLNILFKGRMIPLENTFRDGVSYLRRRLGYNQGRGDYCFNGFAFKDLLYRNIYATNLFDGPELIQSLASFFRYPDLKADYVQKSTYYCLEYLIPLRIVLFDKNDCLSQEEKNEYFLNQIVNRLFKYSTTDKRYLTDDDNPILRLTDDDTLHEEYLVCKEEITLDMLQY